MHLDLFNKKYKKYCFIFMIYMVELGSVVVKV